MELEESLSRCAYEHIVRKIVLTPLSAMQGSGLRPFARGHDARQKLSIYRTANASTVISISLNTSGFAQVSTRTRPDCSFADDPVALLKVNDDQFYVG